MQFCENDHGLKCVHKKEHCEFIQRLNDQKKNLINLPIQFFSVDKFEVETLPQQIQNLFFKAFGHKKVPQHKDILKLSDRIIKNTSGPKKNWNSEQIIIMFWISKQLQIIFNKEIQLFSIQNWQRVSDFVPGRNGRQCMFKFLKTRKVPLSQCPWTPQQQNLLVKIVVKFSPIDWNWVSQQLFFSTPSQQIYRLPKQCRQHWSSYSNSQIKKGPWSPEEDIILLSNVLNNGRRWSQLCKYLSGRTQNAIKNRANLLLNKDLRKFKSYDDNLQVLQLIQLIKKDQDSTTLSFSSLPKQQQKKLGIQEENSLTLSAAYQMQKNITSCCNLDDPSILKQSYPLPPTINSLTQSCFQVHAAYNPVKQQLQIGQQNDYVCFMRNLSQPSSPINITKIEVDDFFSKMCQNYLDFDSLNFSKQQITYDDFSIFYLP